MKQEHFETAHTYELLYRVRQDDGSLSAPRSVEIDGSDRTSLSTRGASKHITGVRFSLRGDAYDEDVHAWIPETLHVHRTLDMGEFRDPSEEERMTVFEATQYQTSGDDLSVNFVPQKPVR